MQKRYWLRGGIIGVIVDVLFLIFGLISSSQEGYSIIFHWVLIALVILIPTGAFFGWTYGKIKNRNKVVVQ
ncbi:MAG: hypothetical protein WCW03_00145 [Candidatus Paceibacterota bacterium]|jgi:hypothetical protein